MHWTYDPPGIGDLEQGDILRPDEPLRRVLEEVHPHFNAGKYLAFIVTTQSCDLVRARGKGGARYIGIATIRSLATVWLKLAAAVVQEPLGAGYFAERDRSRVGDLFKRIVDQNEQALGLFYLHPDGDTCIGDPSVAFLRVTVSLRAEHYDTLVAARSARLRPDFRAKFGWLLGNLYSRAATRDWADQQADQATLKELRTRLVDGDGSGLAPRWIEDDRAKAARKKRVDFSRDVAEVDAELAGLEYKRRIDLVVERVMGKLGGASKLKPSELESLKRRLLGDRELQSLLAPLGSLGE